MIRRYFFVSLVLAFALLLTTLVAPMPSRAQTGERCFQETGFCISGRIREFWEQNGGLSVFGFPVAPQEATTIEGQPFQAQWFERNRLELHPENARPYDVLLGRLGVDRLDQQGRNWFTFPTSELQQGCRFFTETRQNVCGEILAAWRNDGLEIDGQSGKTEAENLGLFGLPVSGVMTETLSDGREYQVQYFERARFELHPENAAPFNVLLGLLGNEIRANGENPTGATPTAALPTATVPPTTPTTTPTVSPTPALPAPSFDNCQEDPGPADAPNFPVQIVRIEKLSTPEIAVLRNVSDKRVDINGWHLCSLKGDQEHEGIGGTLEPGEERGFAYVGVGTIWNNTSQDNAALYNANGQLVSYWVDPNE